MKKGYIFDLDGTIYLGDQLIEGAKETIEALKKRGDKVIFLTNKSIASREDYVKKLRRLGISTRIDEVINSNVMVAQYLQEQLATGEAVLAIGEQPLFEELERHGISTTEAPEKARFVVLGWDRHFTYEKLNKAFQATKYNAEVIATNPDRTCPIKGGEIPDCGAMIGALEGATGKPIDQIIGKPSKYLAEMIVGKILSMGSSDCYIIGDRLETDIKMGVESGMKSVLVLTGISTKEMAARSPYKPTYILESVRDLVNGCMDGRGER
ncbi:MAG TPA: HAD-IIA family hydrolase [Bacillales bacterium]